ncbi:hypothetical protein TKK_0002624 [Trichogramma kaykai]|uniref:NAD(P)H oxidase (H2O2-forming) n=1 Tax=Trichogramma kaykai TaxID=54128 RepID=A0ABD2WYW5_9HYME
MISIGGTTMTSTMQLVSRIKTMRVHLSTLLMILIFSVSSSGAFDGYDKYQRFDGSYNNWEHPHWGKTDSHLTRKTPADYQDEVYMIAGQDRPSARKLSNLFMHGEDGLPSITNKTALFAFFGQVVGMEIIMSSEHGCPIELRKIDVDKCDPIFDKKCEGNKYIPFLRAAYDPKTGKNPNSPRKQINKVTSWIDGSFIYSNDENWAHSMRTHQNGTLRADPSGKFPVRNDAQMPLFNKDVANSHRNLDPKRLFLLGDSRSNQNLPLLVFGILFHRWHNVVANKMKNENPDMSDHELFHEARKFVTATLQNVIMYEYLPALLGEPMPKYSGYNFDLHPGVSPIFQSAAFRFGHSMIPPGILRRNNQCVYRSTRNSHQAIRLCNTWWDASEAIKDSPVEELIMGMTSQLSEREDHLLSAELRDNLFGPLEFTTRDLAALNIMRGRDNGLSDYNTARKSFGLKPRKTWNEINPKLFRNNPELLRTLMETYNNDLYNIDVYVGGMLESSDGPGELFKTVIKEQFLRIRDSDRFWFENDKNGYFSAEEIEEIKKITFWDIIVNATDVEPNDIQRDVFTWHQGDPCPQPVQLKTAMLEPCAPLQHHDYFQNSQFVYTYACIFLCFVPVLCASAGYGVVKLQNRRRRRMRIQQKFPNQIFGGKVNVDKLFVREWLHENFRRRVKIEFMSDSSLHLLNRKGDILRKFRFISGSATEPNMSDPVTIYQSNGVDNINPKRGLVCFRTKNDYDLVLELDSFISQEKFMSKIFTFLHRRNVPYKMYVSNPADICKNAVTREARQEKLEDFFREAYELREFPIETNKARRSSTDNHQEKEILSKNTTLSISEFAKALGMKPDEFFVTHMFKAVDRDGDGRISFKEFCETVVQFAKPSAEDKLANMFKLFGGGDTDSYLHKNVFSDIIRSLVNVARTTSLSDEKVTEIIDDLYDKCHLKEKNHLSFEDFKKIMNKYKSDWGVIGIDLKGANQNFIHVRKNTDSMSKFAIESDATKGRKNFLVKMWKKRNNLVKNWNVLVTFLEENRQHIFFLFVFYVITFVLFTERFFHYSFMAEHTDLRHVMGVGIAITRGSAASLSFCYSLILLTMCRNCIAKLKEFSIHQYVPIDSHVPFHKIVACTAVFFSLVHSVGHLVNFYHISTQPLEHLRCLTPQINFSNGMRPSINFWLFRTVAGVTGILLFIVTTIIFIFSYPTIRKKAYKYFWRTHMLYVLLYLLCLVHGIGRLTSSPTFWTFFIVPGTIFIFDKLLSVRTMSQPLEILATEILPSDVIMIKFFRPPNLRYLSGQWVRLACADFNPREFHAFTLTSAPHEDFLSCHIKAQGPWTWKLRDYFDSCNFNTDVGEPKPKYVYIDGPFGGGNQDWYKFEVAVLIGGGIGVTPYASVLKDLVHNSSTNRFTGFACKKVYFIWVCSSHKHFEWFIDVLREVEMDDEQRKKKKDEQSEEKKDEQSKIEEDEQSKIEEDEQSKMEEDEQSKMEEDKQSEKKKDKLSEKKEDERLLDVHIFITQFFNKFDLRTTMLYICEQHLIPVKCKSIFTGLRAKNHFGRPDLCAFLRYVQNKHPNLEEVGVFSCGPSPLTKGVMSACEEVNITRKAPSFVHHFENFG